VCNDLTCMATLKPSSCSATPRSSVDAEEIWVWNEEGVQAFDFDGTTLRSYAHTSRSDRLAQFLKGEPSPEFLERCFTPATTELQTHLLVSQFLRRRRSVLFRAAEDAATRWWDTQVSLSVTVSSFERC
jgi:hypothetical protein